MADGIREPLPPGWYPDPWEVGPYRRHDGHEWTNDLADSPPPEVEPNPDRTGRRSARRARRAAKATAPAAPAAAPTGTTAASPRRSRVPVLLGTLAVTTSVGGWYLVNQRGYALPFGAGERPILVDTAAASATPVVQVATTPAPTTVPAPPTSAVDDAPPALVADISVAIECHPEGITYTVGEVVEPALYVVDYGDGTVISTTNPSTDPYFGVHAYQAPGTYLVAMGVLGGDGHLGSATCSLTRP